MIEPTHALEDIANETMRPSSDLLRNIVKELLPGASDELIQRASLSIVGQICFYHHCRPAIDKIYPGTRYTRPEIDKLAEHVTQFSLAALKALAPGKQK
jgi:hypothetical protein